MAALAEHHGCAGMWSAGGMGGPSRPPISNRPRNCTPTGAGAATGVEFVGRKCTMAIDTQSGFPQAEDDGEESTTGTTTGTTLGTTTMDSDTTTGDGHPPRVGE